MQHSRPRILLTYSGIASFVIPGTRSLAWWFWLLDLGDKRTRSEETDADELDATNGLSDTVSLFKNAGSGIEKYRTMKTEVRIRARDVHGSAAEVGATSGARQQVEILFGCDEGKLAQAGCKMLEKLEKPMGKSPYSEYINTEPSS